MSGGMDNDGYFTVRSSSLPGLPECELRWFARAFPDLVYDAGFRLRNIRPSIAAPLGSGCHAGAAHLLDAKMKRGGINARVDVTDSIDRAVHEFRRITVETEAEPDDLTPNLPIGIGQVSRMMFAISDHVKTLFPIRVERRLTAIVPETCIRLSGQPDNVDGLGGPLCDTDDLAIRDLKCGRRYWWADPQLGAYAFLEDAQGRAKVKDVKVDWCPRVAYSREQPPVQVVDVNLNDAKRIAWSILHESHRAVTRWTYGSLEAQIKPGCPDVLMANPSSRLCSARWCPAWGTDFCRHGKRD